MNLNALLLPVLLAIFAVAAIAISIAGIHLSDTTNILSKRFGLGEALGGMIILAIVTNLPEIAIVVSASLQHNVGIAVGNILGGTAFQTVVLVILDLFGLGRLDSLTYKSASLILVLESSLVLVVLSFVVVGHQLPSSIIFFRITPIDLLIFIAWIAGILLINKAQKGLPWVANFKVPGEQEDPKGHSKSKKDEQAKKKNKSTGKIIKDRDKISATVAATVLDFTENFPDIMVYAKGSTPARTRLYQMGIISNLDQIEPLLEVYEFVGENWERFAKNVNYEAFIVLRKKLSIYIEKGGKDVIGVRKSNTRKV